MFAGSVSRIAISTRPVYDLSQSGLNESVFNASLSHNVIRTTVITKVFQMHFLQHDTKVTYSALLTSNHILVYMLVSLGTKAVYVLILKGKY